MRSSLVSVRGTRLYVEQYGESNKPALLYLHGGPGSSCIDFTHQQAKALSVHVRVVAIDQRGVLRSDSIHPNESFGLCDIIEDCEALRRQLGIDQWSVLGHSFGGIVAFRYACRYPESVNKVLFETPCFDVQLAMRSLIAGAREALLRLGNRSGVEQCDMYLNGSYSASELWHAWGIIGSLLRDDRDLLYFHGITPEAYNSIINAAGVPEEWWNKNQQHAERLQKEGVFYESLLKELASLSQPSMLLAGRFDLVCCETQQQAYKQHVSNGKVVMFEKSGHFPRLEEPEKYTREVLRFIREEITKSDS